MGELQVLEDFRVRAQALYPEVVERYVEALQEGAELPPVWAVTWPGLEGAPVLIDGRHRLAAWEHVGVAPQVKVMQAESREQAVLEALRQNRTHGHPRQPGDVQRCVEVALATWPWESARGIAARVGCSHTWVNRVRGGSVEAPQEVETPQIGVFEGKVETVSTSEEPPEVDAEEIEEVEAAPWVEDEEPVQEVAEEGRGLRRGKDALERWYTSDEVARDCWRWLLWRTGITDGDHSQRWTLRVLVPSAGDGAWLRGFALLAQERREAGLEVPQVQWTCIDLDPEAKLVGPGTEGVELLAGQDFLTWEPEEDGLMFHLCVDNPPFSRAQEFVARAMGWSAVTAFLLPTGFLHGAARLEWLRENMPQDQVLLPHRPSFGGPAAALQEVSGTSWQTYGLTVWGWRENRPSVTTTKLWWLGTREVEDGE